MLVLSRQSGESINVGHDVVITVNQIKGDRVLIGIDAPELLPIHRSEIYLEIFGADRLMGPIKPNNLGV